MYFTETPCFLLRYDALVLPTFTASRGFPEPGSSRRSSRPPDVNYKHYATFLDAQRCCDFGPRSGNRFVTNTACFLKARARTISPLHCQIYRLAEFDSF